jgi:transcriptional regulator with XRE-family HTH domain
MYNTKEVGRRLKELRRKKRVTQEQVAKELNISVDTLRKNEQGSRSMSVELLDIYAEYYDTDMDYIINGRKNNNNEVIKILENYPLQKQKMALKILKGILDNLE